MPRIHDYILNCVVYQYRSEDEAIECERVGGSGFLVNVPLPSFPDRTIHFVVTNAHVAEKAPVSRLNGINEQLAIAKYSIDDWIMHPDGDDVAIAPLYLPPGNKFSSIPRSLFLSKATIAEFDIGIGDDIFVAGRFINHEGIQRNSPSLRFGNIAQMPGDKIMQGERDFEQESFLVEAKSIGGYSGSPVFVHMLPFSSRPKPDNPQEMLIVPSPGIGPWLLGVDWGHITSNDYVLMGGGIRHTMDLYVRSNTGMMGVVPAWKLDEIFNTERVKKLIHKAEEGHRKSLAGSTSAIDIGDETHRISRDDILRTMLNTPPEPRSIPKGNAKGKKRA
jgi:hypothetical protein